MVIHGWFRVISQSPYTVSHPSCLLQDLDYCTNSVAAAWSVQINTVLWKRYEKRYWVGISPMSVNKRWYNWSNYTCNVDFVMFCTASMNRKASSVCGKSYICEKVSLKRKKGILSKGTNMFRKGTIIHPLGVNKVQKCTVWKKLLFYHKRWSTLPLCQDQKSHLTPQRTSGSHLQSVDDS